MPATPDITVPAYRRIEKALRADIRSGRWGAMLPRRQILAVEYGVSLGTIERAVTSLIADGMLSASSRRGTFVNQNARSSAHSSGFATPAPVQASELPAAGPPKVAAHRRENASLGIVAYYLLSAMESTEHLAYWVRQTAHALTSAYLKPGENSVFHNLHPDASIKPEPVINAVRQLKEQGVGTIVILDMHNDIPAEDLHQLAADPIRNGLKIVYVSSSDFDGDLPHVCFDSAHIGRQAAAYCIQNGFTAFTFVSVHQTAWARARFEAVLTAAERFGLPPGAVDAFWMDPPLADKVNPGAVQRAVGVECGRAIFRSDDFPRCIIALNDFTAYGIMEAAKERNLAAGRDFSLVSFDDAPYSLPNGLTTFRPPLEEIGEEAARMLQRIERGEPSNIQVRLRWNLMVRSSSQYLPNEREQTPLAQAQVMENLS